MCYDGDRLKNTPVWTGHPAAAWRPLQRSLETMTTTAKTLGVVVPVLVATTFCLSVPFILIVADVAILAGAVIAFVAQRRAPVGIPAEDLPELE
jgi:hypothetical protein